MSETARHGAEEGTSGQTEKWRHLPERISSDDMITEQPEPPAPAPITDDDQNRINAIRYAAP